MKGMEKAVEDPVRGGAQALREQQRSMPTLCWWKRAASGVPRATGAAGAGFGSNMSGGTRRHSSRPDDIRRLEVRVVYGAQGRCGGRRGSVRAENNDPFSGANVTREVVGNSAGNRGASPVYKQHFNLSNAEPRR